MMKWLMIFNDIVIIFIIFNKDGRGLMKFIYIYIVH